MTEPPRGWAWATLPDLISSDGIFTDGDWVETKDQDPAGDVRLTQLADVGDGVFRNRSNRFMTSDAAARLGCTYLCPGDVLVARMPDPLGRACIFPGDTRPAVTAVDVCVVRPGSSSIDPRWLMWWINTPQLRGEVAARQVGTTRKRISRKNLAAIDFPVPPLGEQRRIVAAIEEQLSRLDGASRMLAAARTHVDTFVERSLAEVFSIEGAPERKLGDVATWGSGGTPKSSEDAYYGGPIPWAVIGDLNDGVVTATRSTITETGLAASAAKVVDEGTVLIAMYGSIGKLGIAGMAMATNQAIAFAIPGPDIHRDYLFWFLRAQRSRLAAVAKGATQANISQTILRAWPIPVPSLASQQQLVVRAETAISAAKTLRHNIGRADARASSLRRAILARAYRGELVPQAPEDEPASALLKRIADERAVAPKPTRRRRERTPA